MNASYAVLACSLVLLPAGPLGAGEGGQPHQQVPAQADRQKALESIRNLFAEKYKNKTPSAFLMLSQDLFVTGIGTTDDPALRFVLLEESTSLALQSGDVTTALAAADEQGKSFEVDSRALRGDMLRKFGKNVPPWSKTGFGEACLDECRFLLSRDAITSAKEFAELAANTARGTEDRWLTRRAEGVARRIQRLVVNETQLKSARGTVSALPDDGGANEVLGRYLCFAVGDWESGLPFLAKAADAELASLAKDDLQALVGPVEQARVGERWATFSLKVAPDAKDASQERAVYWLERALPQLSGFKKEQTTKQLASLTGSGSRKDSEVGMANLLESGEWGPLYRKYVATYDFRTAVYNAGYLCDLKQQVFRSTMGWGKETVAEHLERLFRIIQIRHSPETAEEKLAHVIFFRWLETYLESSPNPSELLNRIVYFNTVRERTTHIEYQVHGQGLEGEESMVEQEGKLIRRSLALPPLLARMVSGRKPGLPDTATGLRFVGWLEGRGLNKDLCEWCRTRIKATSP